MIVNFTPHLQSVIIKAIVVPFEGTINHISEQMPKRPKSMKDSPAEASLHVSRAVLELIEAKGMVKSRVAEALGLSRSGFANLLTAGRVGPSGGVRTWSVDHLVRAAEALGVSPMDLLPGEDRTSGDVPESGTTDSEKYLLSVLRFQGRKAAISYLLGQLPEPGE